MLLSGELTTHSEGQYRTRVVCPTYFMSKNKRGRVAAAQRSFHSRPRHRSRRGRRGRFRVWALSVLFLASSCSLFFVGWKLHSRVLDLRVGRAYESARQVLKQTQRPQVEQERYASAI